MLFNPSIEIFSFQLLRLSFLEVLVHYFLNLLGDFLLFLAYIRKLLDFFNILKLLCRNSRISCLVIENLKSLRV